MRATWRRNVSWISTALTSIPPDQTNDVFSEKARCLWGGVSGGKRGVVAECKADAEGWGARSHGPGSERDPGGWVRGPVGA